MYLSTRILFLSVITVAAARGNDASLVMPLSEDLRVSKGSADISISGPHRFVRVAGKTGYQPLSLETKLRIGTSLHKANAGSILLWVAPLESLSAEPSSGAFLRKDPLARNYNLLSDTWPARDFDKAIFAWQWHANWNPTVFARFLRGPILWDQRSVPWVFTEHLPLEEKNWYQLGMTWNKSEHRYRMYVNGILSGNNLDYSVADEPNPELYLGNTAMVFRNLQIWDSELEPRDIDQQYRQSGMPSNPSIQKHLADLMVPQVHPSFVWSPTSDWKLVYENSFTKAGDLEGWIQQGCLQDPFRMREKRITPGGLLLETPPETGNESRVYLWSPRNFEGDIAVEFEFRPERDSGLALVVIQASGMQREDFITDQPPRTTGSMATIIADRVRNYHWEFFRRYNFNLRNGFTQILAKNPWERPMAMSSLPLIELNQIHRLQFVQEGRRLRGTIDGQLVFDAMDDPFVNSGPVYSFGRIGIRLMYNTRMTIRNLQVWNRNLGVEVVR